MTRQEFDKTWARVMSRLTAEEREVVETVIAGAEANHSAGYMIACALLGVVGGWGLCTLFGG